MEFKKILVVIVLWCLFLAVSTAVVVTTADYFADEPYTGWAAKRTR